MLHIWLGSVVFQELDELLGSVQRGKIYSYVLLSILPLQRRRHLAQRINIALPTLPYYACLPQFPHALESAS